MTQAKLSNSRLQGRLFPKSVMSSEELARRKAEKDARCQRYREIFLRINPELIDKYYNWFLVIEPESGDFFVDSHEEIAVQKARQKYPQRIIGIHRINETGACGTL